jgi:hypothetical protein
MRMQVVINHYLVKVYKKSETMIPIESMARRAFIVTNHF